MIIVATEKECKKVNLPMSEKSAWVKYKKDDQEVFFSYSVKGEALDCHIAASQKSKTLLREAVNEFCNEVFRVMPFIKKITGSINKKTVVNLLLKCGFVLIDQKKCKINGSIENIKFMARFRDGFCS